MIPLLARIKFKRNNGFTWHIPVPLFLIYPLAIPVIPFYIAIGAYKKKAPIRTINIYWSLLSGLRGTRFNMSKKNKSFSIAFD